MINYQEAEWDSNFFGCIVIIINQTYPQDNDPAEISKILRDRQPDLAYLFVAEELSINIAGYNCFLADRRKIYVKRRLENSSEPDNIREYNEPVVSQQLLRLGYQSGEQSRFRVDPWFGEHQFKRLYQQWLEGSVSGKLARKVFVFQPHTEILGLITVNSKSEKGSIGLLAVDQVHRGIGIGKLLMQSAENWCIKNGLTELQVVTQATNTAACNLYERSGFIPLPLQYIYHLHKQL